MTEFKLVPVEPTLEMIDAARSQSSFPEGVWRAMLAAAPQQAAEPSARFEYSHGDGQGTVTMLLGEIAHGAELYTGHLSAVACPVCLDSGFYPVGGPYLCTHCEKGNEVIKGHPPAQPEQPAPIPTSEQLDPVDGDCLPIIGSKVFIHLASTDSWVEHEVVGYYAWGDLRGDKNLHRVFVRVKNKDGIPNSRLLKDVVIPPEPSTVYPDTGPTRPAAPGGE
jgi:hypothetical protein